MHWVKIVIFLLQASTVTVAGFNAAPCLKSRRRRGTFLCGGGFGSAGSVSRKSKKNKKKKTKSAAAEEVAEVRKPALQTPVVQTPAKSALQTAGVSLRTQLDSALNEIASSPSVYHPVGADEVEFCSMLPVLLKTRGFSERSLARVGDAMRMNMLLNAVKSDECKKSLLPSDFDPRRPIKDVHAFMPGLRSPSPFLDPSSIELVAKLESNVAAITDEYEALKKYLEDREREGKEGGPVEYKSLTKMNYSSGWSSMCLFSNGLPIKGFPFDLCPTLASILSTVPIAGRICGFNRQLPRSGIPEHSDGNNMWLTLQLPIYCEEGAAYIMNGGSKHVYEVGKCTVYDTTYSHYTFNDSQDQERIVLHVDFWNYLQMTTEEIAAMQYIYELKGMLRSA